MTICERIKRAIANRKSATVTMADLSRFGEISSITKALQRLIAENRIQRIGKGVYSKLQYSPGSSSTTAREHGKNRQSMYTPLEYTKGIFGTDTPTSQNGFAPYDLKKCLVDYVWNTMLLHGTKVKYHEIMTMNMGASPGGLDIADFEQIWSMLNTARKLASSYIVGSPTLDFSMLCSLHSQVCLPESDSAFSYSGRCAKIWSNCIAPCLEIQNIYERSLTCFVNIAVKRPFRFGNKRVATLFSTALLLDADATPFFIAHKTLPQFKKLLRNTCSSKSRKSVDTLLQYMRKEYL